MLPAQQGLGRHHLSRGKVDTRLQHDPQLLGIVESGGEIIQQPELPAVVPVVAEGKDADRLLCCARILDGARQRPQAIRVRRRGEDERGHSADRRHRIADLRSHQVRFQQSRHRGPVVQGAGAAGRQIDELRR